MCCTNFTGISTGWSTICSACGVEMPTLQLDTYSHFSAPLARTYDRIQRFTTKVDRMLGLIHPGEQDPIWKFLESQTLQGPKSVRGALRRCPLKSKHYDCTKTFCDVFTAYRCGVFDFHKTKTYLLTCFRDVHDAWLYSSRSGSGFFSYDWLMRRFLEKSGHPLLVYLKPRTSKRRNQRYLNMIKQSQHDDRTWNQSS